MTIDVITQWCVYNDYPLYRKLFTEHRDKVNKIILYPSRQHGIVDLESFAKDNFKETWVERGNIDYGKVDWRQAETEVCLAYSDAEWVWFVEQDFFVDDWELFFTKIKKDMEHAKPDMIGYWNATNFPYVHPCCLFIKRSMLEKTKKDFSAHPETNGSDHFAMITQDVKRLGGIIHTLEDLGYKEWENMFHLGGLTYPYQDFKGEDTIFGVKRPDVFAVYNHMSRTDKVPQSPDYIKLSLEIEEILKKKFPDLDLENNEWTRFFK